MSLIYSISYLIINDVKSNWEMGNMNNICMNKNNWLQRKIVSVEHHKFVPIQKLGNCYDAMELPHSR